MAKETETKKTISHEKALEAKKAAVLKEKEKQQEKAKEAKKAAVQKEKEKQKANLEKEKEKLKEQQKAAINAAVEKEREKLKVKQDQAVDKAVLKERARIRELLASGKDPFGKENPLTKSQLKKATEIASKPEEPEVEEPKEEVKNPELDNLAKRLGQKKSLDDLFKEKEKKAQETEDGLEEKDLNHVELLRKKREAQMKLNQEEKKDAFDFDPSALQEKIDKLEKEVENKDIKIDNLLSELDHKNNELKELKDNKQDNKADEELKNKDLKIENLLSELDHKNEVIKELQNEVNAKDNELGILSLQLEKVKDELKNGKAEPKKEVEITPEVVQIKETGEILIRINVIKEKIQEKNEQIKAVEDELDKLSEKDIIDKDFLNEVRRIRLDRNSLIEATQEQLKALAKTVTDNEKVLESDKKQLALKDEEIAKFNEKLKEKMSYADREQLLYDRSKVIASRDSLAIHIEVLSENCQKYYDRYNREFTHLEESVNALNKQEEELIKVYLEKLRSEKGGDNPDYVSNVEERDALIEELGKLNQEMDSRRQEEATILSVTNNRPAKPDEDEVLVGLRSKLAQIEGKLIKINDVRNERLQVEKVLRTSDKPVIDYLTLMASKETLTYMISEDQKRLDKANVDLRDHPLKAKKSLFGKVKYDPVDMEKDKARRDEIKRLENALLENKKKLDEVNENLKKYDFDEKVLFYKKLLVSIEELNAKDLELTKRASDLKDSINSRLDELKG